MAETDVLDHLGIKVSFGIQMLHDMQQPNFLFISSSCAIVFLLILLP